jgi:predicted HD superfamily hydrolase involved in NAD metabolism
MTGGETTHTGRDEGLLAQADALARERLSDRRYEHTLRVAQTAERLALLHGIDPHRTRLAALLHDAARELSVEDHLLVAERWNLPVGQPELESPKLLHGPIAAELARRELGVEDEDVLEAVRVHTVGAPNMSLIALALYMADKTEPARDYPSVGHLRNLSQEDLRRATIEALQRVIAHNEQRERPIHPSSRAMLDWLEETHSAG